ncbi:MAG: hypothetical protein WC360_07875 [Opitutales bacterium]|jgi:3-oxoacyl-(acyl-carrier-protein) synthase
MPATQLDMSFQNDIRILSFDCVTPFGNSAATHKALVEGRSNVAQYPVTGNDGGQEVPLSLFDHMHAELPPRWFPTVTNMLAPVSGSEWGRVDTPIFVSSSNFGVDSLYYLRRDGRSEQQPYAVPHSSVEQIRRACGWGRNVSLYSHACVSAHIAILAASMALMCGAKRALVLSYDFISPFVTGGFSALKILNGQLPRPFHRAETGSIALGEGAAYAILSLEGKGPRISAQSTWNEMFHFTANEPEGSGFAKLLEPILPALRDSRIWLKGHGTGTVDAGRIEAESLAKAFPEAPLTGWKGAIGHTLGSCGLIELAIALRSIESGTAPGSVGSEAPTFTPNVALAPFSTSCYDAALILSNAFGGAHATMCIRND